MVITLVVQLALLFFAELNIDQFITPLSNSINLEYSEL